MKIETSCYEVVSELDQALRGALADGHDYLVLGGLVSAALAHPDSAIELNGADGYVYAAPDSAIPTIRNNNTKRDVDILIPSLIDDQEAERLKQVAREATDDRLRVSICAFNERRDDAEDDNIVVSFIKGWVSERTVDDKGILRYEMGPLEQVVEPASYRPWRLVLPHDNSSLQILHPVGHVLAYRMRSSSGVRKKDKQKLAEMSDNVMSVGGMYEAQEEGVFKEWKQFAEAVKLSYDWGIKLGHPILKSGASLGEAVALHYKGRLLHVAESLDFVVKLAQGGPVEKMLNRFTGVK